jgi:NAD(P)H-flavin reductase
MACGMGTCKGCAIKDVDGNFKYVCTDGPVFEAARVFGGQK